MTPLVLAMYKYMSIEMYLCGGRPHAADTGEEREEGLVGFVAWDKG
jgi:hypothetical protein